MDTATNVDFSTIPAKQQVRFTVGRSVNELRANIEAERDRLLRLNIGGETFRLSFLGIQMLLAALVDRLKNDGETGLSARVMKVYETWHAVNPRSVSYLGLQEIHMALAFEIEYSKHESTRQD